MPTSPMIQPSGQKKRKGLKKSVAYATGAILGGVPTLQILRSVRSIIPLTKRTILPTKRMTKITLINALLGALIARSLQHSYRKSRVRAPQSPKARAVAASALKGGVGGLITGPLIGWRDLRSKMGKQYAPLKTL